VSRLTGLRDSQFLRFLAAGGTSAALNFSSRFLFSLAMSYELAVLFAYLVGIVSAYALMRWFVFDASGRGVGSELFRFTLINLVGLVQVWVISVGLVRLVFPWAGFDWYAEGVAHFLGLSSLAITSFFAHRHFSFRPAATGRAATD
jgi:putative flippase GtrA